MRASLNIQCQPTPVIWVSTGQTNVPILTDENREAFTDEAGNAFINDPPYVAPEPSLMEKDEADNKITDENQSEITTN